MDMERCFPLANEDTHCPSYVSGCFHNQNAIFNYEIAKNLFGEYVLYEVIESKRLRLYRKKVLGIFNCADEACSARNIHKHKRINRNALHLGKEHGSKVENDTKYKQLKYFDKTNPFIQFNLFATTENPAPSSDLIDNNLVIRIVADRTRPILSAEIANVLSYRGYEEKLEELAFNLSIDNIFYIRQLIKMKPKDVLPYANNCEEAILSLRRKLLALGLDLGSLISKK